MSLARPAVLRPLAARRCPASAPRRWYASHGGPEYTAPQKSEGGFRGIFVALGIVAVVVPGSLYLLSSGQDHVPHNDHEGQKRLHTSLTHVEKSKKAGTGGKLLGIDEVVTTKAEDVDHHLPADALNHPVNREKIEKTMQMKPPSKRVDPLKSVN